MAILYSVAREAAAQLWPWFLCNVLGDVKRGAITNVSR